MIDPNGLLHINVYCPKCGSEMIEIEFEKKNSGASIIWKPLHKCPKCNTKVDWK